MRHANHHRSLYPHLSLAAAAAAAAPAAHLHDRRRALAHTHTCERPKTHTNARARAVIVIFFFARPATTTTTTTPRQTSCCKQRDTCTHKIVAVGVAPEGLRHEQQHTLLLLLCCSAHLGKHSEVALTICRFLVRGVRAPVDLANARKACFRRHADDFVANELLCTLIGCCCCCCCR